MRTLGKLSTHIITTGGSGLGKTEFCKKVASQFFIPYKEEAPRKRYACSDFRKLPQIAKQIIFALDYANHHFQQEIAILDRCVLDVFAWIGYEEAVKFLEGITSPLLVIVVPTPSVNFYIKNIERWTGDPVRLQTWNEKLGVYKVIEDIDFARAIHHDECLFEKRIEQMCKDLNWNYFIPDIDRNDVEGFYKWQELALKKIEDKIV